MFFLQLSHFTRSLFWLWILIPNTNCTSNLTSSKHFKLSIKTSQIIFILRVNTVARCPGYGKSFKKQAITRSYPSLRVAVSVNLKCCHIVEQVITATTIKSSTLIYLPPHPRYSADGAALLDKLEPEPFKLHRFPDAIFA